MSNEVAKAIWGKKYDREQLLGFLQHKLNVNRSAAVQSDGVRKLGFAQTQDDKKVLICEVQVSPQTRIPTNRSGLRNLVAKHIDGIDVEGALASFYTSKDPNWRLSFVAKKFMWEDGKPVKKETEATRYTFLLGPDAQTRTTQERLNELDKSHSLAELEEAFAVEPLNKEFYQELVSWYKAANKTIRFPSGTGTLAKCDSASLIRLITRMLFIWFLKEKQLLSKDLFDIEQIKEIIYYNKKSSYYKAILQNLFFATLNNKMENRGFARKTSKEGQASPKVHYEYGQNSRNPLFRIVDREVKELFSMVPFLNGGLFECLDSTSAAPPHPTW